jgi:hypothetical protein
MRVEARQVQLTDVWQRYIGIEREIPAAEQTVSTLTDSALTQ